MAHFKQLEALRIGVFSCVRDVRHRRLESVASGMLLKDCSLATRFSRRLEFLGADGSPETGRSFPLVLHMMKQCYIIL